MTRASARRRSRLLAAGLSLMLLPAGQAVAAGATGTTTGTYRAASPAHAPTTAPTVTLITGDRVTVTDLGAGRKSVAVERPADATGAVRTEISGGRITVVPDEARPYLQAGVLDAELFDVTALIEQGLGDSSSAGLPLIVTYTKNARSAAPRGARQVRGLPSVGGAALEASRSGEFWRTVASHATSRSPKSTSAPVRLAGGVEKIWLDARVDTAMEGSNAQIGTPAAWEAGLTGKGVKVAVLDTGVDLTHPDLKDRVSETKSFIDGQEVADRNGHGTHVSSTVGGSGAASDGKEKGVAPDTTLAVGKVLSDQGSGTESQIIAGMEWAAKDVQAKIVSMSLGSSQGSDGTDPMAQAVNTLSRDTGALFVIAAGNSGAPGSIGSPGAADSALTIGAVDSADRLASFSSQGPRRGDNALKPDLSAPGVGILAARSQLVSGSGPYTSLSGTSMATPHVAGVAALLAEKHPDWSGQQLKDGLMSTSKQISGTSYQVGAGRVDVRSAITAQITATGSADLGFIGWPYESNEPVTRTLTYTNASDRPVTLALTAEGAPSGVVVLADSTLTVPARGTAQTTVTRDGAAAPVGTTSGRIVAKAGETEVAHTSFGMTKENERYTLIINVKDRDGAPSAAYVAVKPMVKGSSVIQAPVDDSGTLELRLEPGSYNLSSFLDVRGNKGKDSLGLGLLAEPEVTLDRNREVTLDGRALREIRAEVDQRTETRQRIMKFSRTTNGESFSPSVQVPANYDSIFAAPTRKPATGTFEYRTVWRLGKPQLDVEAGGTRLGEAVVQRGSDLFTGRERVSLVDTGTGSATDYAGKHVKGKAVVVRRTDAIAPADLAQNAQDAGAKALFVTDDAPGRLLGNFASADGATRPLYIATVNAADGARLTEAARRNRGVDLTGTENTPYVYDLTEGYSGATPTDLTYRPGKSELAVVNNKFHAPKEADGSEFRYSITDNFPVGMGIPERIKLPAKRTDYISARPDRAWHQSVTNGPNAIEEREGVVHHRGGTRSSVDWFKPVWHPWLGTGVSWGQERSGNYLQFNTPGWGDSGPDHSGFGNVWHETSMTQVTEVYVDGVRVDRKLGSGAYARDARVKPTEQDFRVVTDTTLDPEVWHLSTKGHSEWTFKSSATPVDRWTYLPMLNLGFDVDTDIHGDVRAGKRLDLGIFSEYVKGAPDTGKITDSTLEVSFDDGATWRSVELDGVRGRSASRTGSVRVPNDAQYISVRASAADDRGGSVKQEIIRALGVRK
ncbi:S8 family serine peptidase [Streptomyces sp. NPDC005566]|uniref:S8 family serine peptidase n=1 Tax=Streptomyces sp. NPDC005566 TaxID=3156886 RepID=UPI0033AD536D